VKRHAKKNPVLVGFGIKTPTDAQRIAQHADGVIIGSALIQKITQVGTATEIGDWVRQLKNAI
jgi:tryptophan synthase alpha chain